MAPHAFQNPFIIWISLSHLDGGKQELLDVKGHLTETFYRQDDV